MWDLTAGPWVGDDVEPACIRLLGSGNDIQITNCRFVDVTRPVRLKTTANGVLDRIVIADNEVSRADHAAFEVADDGDWGVKFPTGTLRDVKILRNKLDHVGLRPSRFGQGHAVEIRCPETLEMAGNILDRMYGAGLFVFGGKQNNALVDRPMVRLLIHHNKVTDSLLNCNDYGGIETWQGGPAYVFNNISGNPGGYWHYSHKLNPTKPGAARFGHAYYLDGAFKNYHFNNIAWGKSSDPLSRLGNTSAFQEIHSYQNTFFNNTIHKFQIGSRRQAPVAGRNKMLGNVWQDIGIMVFRDADPAKTQPDGNAADAGPQKSSYAYETNAYRDNVFHQIADLGVFEETGRIWPTFEEYAKALAARQSMASDLGTMAQQPPLPKADEHDFRPAPNSAATDRGAVVFVPWSLKAVVGEWNFVMPGGQPEQILDEHWYMTPYFIDRADYHIRPMYPLQAVNVTSDDYVEGALEDWAPGALKLNGQNQYATLTNAALDQPFEYQAQYTQPGWATVTMPKAAVVGEVVTVTVTLSKPDPKLKLRADLHWGKKDGSYGGFNAYGGDAQPVAGAGPYTFRIRSADKPDIGSLNLTLWTTPTGDFGDAVDVARIPLASCEGDHRTQQVEAGGGHRRPGVGKGADLKNPEFTPRIPIEYVFRAATGGEVVLLQKWTVAGILDARRGRQAPSCDRGGGSKPSHRPAALNDASGITSLPKRPRQRALRSTSMQQGTAQGWAMSPGERRRPLLPRGTPQGRVWLERWTRAGGARHAGRGADDDRGAAHLGVRRPGDPRFHRPQDAGQAGRGGDRWLKESESAGRHIRTSSSPGRSAGVQIPSRPAIPGTPSNQFAARPTSVRSTTPLVSMSSNAACAASIAATRPVPRRASPEAARRRCFRRSHGRSVREPRSCHRAKAARRSSRSGRRPGGVGCPDPRPGCPGRRGPRTARTLSASGLRKRRRTTSRSD